jgi:hypothetical protein
MPETARTQSPLLSGTFGKIGFAAILMLLLGTFMGLMQVLILSGQAQIGQGNLQFAPGLLAMILLGWFGLQVFSRGHFAVYPNQITGKKKMGPKFTLPFEPGYQINLESQSLRMEDANGKIIFLQPNPKPAKVAGLLWMRFQYPWMAEWMELGTLTTPNGHDKRFLSGLRRTFEPDGGAPFHDAGFMVVHEQEAWYFPWSDTYQFPQKGSGQSSFRQAISGNEPVLRFSPNPSLLPLPEIVFGLMESDWEWEKKKIILQELAQNHAGAYFPQFDANAKEWVGELAEIPLKVEYFKSGQPR